MVAWTRSSSAARSASDQRDEPALAHRVGQRPEVVARRQPQERRASTLTSSATAARRAGPRGASRSQGTPVNWTAWVTSWNVDPGDELLAGSASSSRPRGARFGATNSSRGGPAGSVSASSYWPEHAARPGSRRAPPISAPRQPAAGAQRAAERAAAAGRAAAASGIEQRAHRGEVGVAPTSARPTSSARRSGAGRAQAACRRRRAARAPATSAARSPGSGGVVAAAEPPTAAATRSASPVGRSAPARSPASCVERGLRSGARGDDRRARLRGPAGRRAGRRSAGKATSAAALADDELAGGGVDRARAPQRGHPVDARRGDLAQRDRDRARCARTRRRRASSAS